MFSLSVFRPGYYRECLIRSKVVIPHVMRAMVLNVREVRFRGAMPVIHHYRPNDKEYAKFKALVLGEWMAQAGGLVWTKTERSRSAPLGVIVVKIVPTPKDRTASTRNNGGVVWSVVRPDVDNITKGVLDSLQPTVMADDSQVVFQLAGKLEVSDLPGPMFWFALGEIEAATKEVIPAAVLPFVPLNASLFT